MPEASRQNWPRDGKSDGHAGNRMRFYELGVVGRDTTP